MLRVGDLGSTPCLMAFVRPPTLTLFYSIFRPIGVLTRPKREIALPASNPQTYIPDKLPKMLRFKKFFEADFSCFGVFFSCKPHEGVDPPNPTPTLTPAKATAVRAPSPRDVGGLKKVRGPPRKRNILGTAVCGMFEGFEKAVKSTTNKTGRLMMLLTKNRGLMPWLTCPLY